MGNKLRELMGRTDKESVRVTAYLEPEMAQSFKMFCKSKGFTMSQCIEALVEDLLTEGATERQVSSISRIPSVVGSDGQ